MTTVIEDDIGFAQAARGQWIPLETIHDVTYFAPQARQAGEAIGLRGFWRSYFAFRAAPLGLASAATVTAAFASFAAEMVHRAIPAVWVLTTPERALDARLDGAVAALRDPVTQCGLGGPEISAAADALRVVVEAMECDGRPLAAGNAALAWPDEPLAALWHGATVLREYRGDGHIAARIAYGVNALQADVLRDAADDSGAVMRAGRGHTPQRWAQAQTELIERGLISVNFSAADAGGVCAAAITPAGSAVRESIERRTDVAAAAPWRSLKPEAARMLGGVSSVLAAQLVRSRVIVYPTPIGAPSPLDESPDELPVSVADGLAGVRSETPGAGTLQS